MKYVFILMLICIADCAAAKSPQLLFNDHAATSIKLTPAYSVCTYPSYLRSDHQRGKMNAATVAAYILAYSGGFMVGYTLGTAIAGGDPNWAVAGIGAGLIGIAIPLSIIGKRHSEKYAAASGMKMHETSSFL